MRRCLSCGRVDERRRVCPDDGDVLVSEGRPVPETGRILDGRYKLGNLIGEGGMGQVFEATDVASGQIVAVKLLKSGLVAKNAERRFRIEAEVMTALNHPGIVRIFEFRKSQEGWTYIVMERLVGPTFSELRRAGKFASPERVVEVVREACETVAAAHERKIVHRDLKPSNLVLHRIDRERSCVKILDFGIAKFMSGNSGEGLTATGEMVGTLLYMAPEQTRGKRVSPATDVYSLGVILFEALAGRLPFQARTAPELVWMQASSPAPAVSTFRPDISDDLDDLVARCLAKRPENRFLDGSALAKALGEVRALRTTEEPVSSTRTMRVNPSLWVGSMLDERYELLEWIAPGRFKSHVYRARHLHTGAEVAVRVWRTGKGAVRDCLTDAFRNEARAMGVRHPNLITIVDLGFTDECVYIVTEFVESVSLRAVLQRQRVLPLTMAGALVRGAAEALGTLHAKGIVSGGLSPETIRVTGSIEAPSQMLLSPLGLTNLRQVEALVDPVDIEGDRVRDYMAPEQQGGATPDARSDLYSLGLLFIEMIGGTVHEPPPTVGRHRTGSQSVARRRRGIASSFTPLLPTDLPEAWSQFLLRAIAPSPDVRFTSSVEFLAAIPLAPAGAV